VISFISVSLFLNGWVTFSETKLKFTRRLRIVILGFAAASILNIGLNFYFVRLFDYTWAAKTTLMAFLFLFVFFIVFDTEVYAGLIRKYYPKLILLFVTIAIILIIDLLFRIYLDPQVNIINTLAKLLLYSVILYSVIYMLIRKKDPK